MQYKWGIRSHGENTWLIGLWNGPAMDPHSFTHRRKKNVGKCAFVLLFDCLTGFDAFLQPLLCLAGKNCPGLHIVVSVVSSTCEFMCFEGKAVHVYYAHAVRLNVESL